MSKKTAKTDNQSTESKSIYQRIIEFQAIMKPVKKNASNPFFKSKYAPLDAVQDAIKEDLAKSGLGYIQTTTQDSLKTTLFTIEGETIDFEYPCNLNGTAQQIGSNITYAKRYSLVALLGLIIEGDDDDGNEAQKQPQSQKKNESIVWLSSDQYKKLKEMKEKDEQMEKVHAAIKRYSGQTIDGVTYKMSNNFKNSLNKLLSKGATNSDQALPEINVDLNEHNEVVFS